MLRRNPSLAGGVLLLLAYLLPHPARAAGERYPGGLRPPLDQVLEDAAPGALVPVTVVLKDQVGRDRVALAAAGLAPREARRAVTDLLKRNSRATQGPLLSRLRRLEGQGRAARVRSLWIGNVVAVDAPAELIREIAARPEVDWVNHNPRVDVFLERDRLGRDSRVPQPPTLPAAANVECGVQLMRAPEVWSELGVTGQGAVIAVIDTGVCWTHPDIKDQIWVNPGEDLDSDGVAMDPDDMNGLDDDGNGFVDDLIGWDFQQHDNMPNDTDSHGSHVAGTVAGDGHDGTQAGMAPDARIMVLRAGVAFTDEFDVWSAMQYAADNGADAISLSLGWPHNRFPDRVTWRQNCENTIDAGTAMIVAAGNEGSGNAPDNVRTPGDVPRVITVGAVDCSDTIASFSSQGPVTWEEVAPYNDFPYPPGLVKPDVSGPGVSTESHDVCAGYSLKSGTSMSTPHVAGAVALMKTADPSLSHDELKQMLEETAIDLGSPGKDNAFGSGRVDAFEAVEKALGLRIYSVSVDDGDLDLANGDGGIDTGEIVTLAITLENLRADATATTVRGSITTGTPGVVLVHDYAEWPDVVPLGLEPSLAPHFSLRVDQGCNYPIDLVLNLRFDGHDTVQPFNVRVGSPFERTLLQDDFEQDAGWTVSGSAVAGHFVREDPQEVLGSSGVVQPADDVTAAPGTVCWVTGNNDTAAGTDDVDGGTTILTSPPLDATDFADATFRYWRWFSAFPTTAPPSDFFRVSWTRDPLEWHPLEELSASEAAWTEVELPAPPSALGPNLRLRFEVDDAAIVPFDSVVEGLVDEVTIAGHRIECDDFTPPLASPPNPVGDTLRVSLALGDVRLDWDEPAPDGQHDAATLYRIYRSDRPDEGFAQDGLSSEPFHVDSGEAGAPGAAYWLVVSENGGGTSE